MGSALHSASVAGKKDGFAEQATEGSRGPGASLCEKEIGSTIHQLFEAQALRSPAGVAAVFEDQRLTYRELNERANALAHHLLNLGVQPETVVGLCVERSIEMLVGILGILKAGAAYLPLDPHYPHKRLALMLADANVGLVVTKQDLASQLPQEGTAVICLDRDRERIDKQAVENPAVHVLPENAAYVIYTSGSTGKPKGVVVTHGNVLRLFTETQPWFNFSQDDVWTLFHSYAFDFSVWEMWGALFHGGKVVIVPYFVSRNPEAFHELLCRERVTVLSQTPSSFRQLIQADAQQVNPGRLALRLVIFGGEALELQSLKPWLERHGDQHPQLVNMFGITETTVHVTYRRILQADVDAKRGSVIGRPIPDLQVHLLDHHINPVSEGETGEMYVGGQGLARGYWHRPGLTAERFVPDPFSKEGGARLYRTGDLARLRNSDLEYLGRVDDQVKVRGFRIELGEIESAIMQYPGLTECVVTAHQDENGDKRLAAYVASGNALLDLDALRNSLKERLPDYMIPAAFIPVKSLPLTEHDKVDRRSLPQPTWGASASVNGHKPPRTSLEEALAEAWKEALDLSSIGIDDNFFDAGGDSIRSIKVRAKALAKGVNFTLQQLFQNPTVRKLSEEISHAHVEPESSSPYTPFSMISVQDREKMPADIEDAYPISQLQAGMVFHSEYSRDYSIYVSSLRLRLPFDAAKMQSALDQMAVRHEMLRTSFDGNTFRQPLQFVHRNARVELHVEDLRPLAEDEQQSRIDHWLKEETRQAFPWSEAPLLRFQVQLRRDDEIQFTMSEPFLDGWSVASLLTELFHRYFALLHEKPLPASPLAAAYKDFVALEQDALQSEQCRGHWNRMLADATATHIVHRRTAASAEALEVRRLAVPISQEDSERLKKAARGAGISVKALLLAAHMKVVSALSGQAEVFTGLLINGRPEIKDGEQLIGAFLNTVPFRMLLESGTWIDLARHAHEAETELLPFRRYPIQELQRVHDAERLFDTIFNYTHFHVMGGLAKIPGMEVLDVRGSEQTYYPLTAQFSVNEFTSRIELVLDYRTLTLDEDQVQEIAACYGRVIAAIAQDPSSHHDSLSLLSPEQHRLLVKELNETSEPFDQGKCLHQLFEQQVRIAPEALAVVFKNGKLENESLTYDELDRRANQLAHHLQGLGVGLESLVGICVKRTPEMLVGLLGILKAGAAYLPLDSAYPKERLAFMIADAGVKLVITHKALKERTAECARHVCLDSDWKKIEKGSGVSPAGGASPDNLAYVIYTSGSTGKPKGVLIEHRGVVNVIEASITKFGIHRGRRVAQLGSLNFDVSVLEIFSALLSGATLLLVDSMVSMSGPELGKFLRDNEVTTMAILPSLLDLVPTGNYPALSAIVVGGEACTAEVAAQWSAGRLLFNAYAPTEATIYSTLKLCAEGQRQTPTLGRPIQNMQVYLLDHHGQPPPAGVPGELHIGGVGVARGYLNRPELTAEKFIPDPFSGRTGARLYKTGDLARFLPEGNLEFLGRTDNQVKIRGFRIELAEIETVLGEHPLVREVAVLAREDAPGDKRIAAYIVPRAGHAPDSSDLRNHLKRRLPDYMLPSVFVILQSMPLSETGKIDRESLPAPEQSRPALEQSYTAPATALEKVLAGIFGEVLKIERVGVCDSFFELGGHSLLATRVVSKVRQTFAIELPVRKLFEEPTVSGLAGVISKNERARIERTAELLCEISAMSDDAVTAMLEEPLQRVRKEKAS
jgi:amino acid adenylation domain-containing protein